MTRDEEGSDSAREMPFREKSAWVSLGASVIVYGWYFAGYAEALAAGNATRHVFIGRLILSFFVLTVLEIVGQVYLAVRAPKDANARADERERRIRMRAIWIAYGILTVGVWMTVGALWGEFETFFVMNMLFFFLVLATIARTAAEIVQFRREA
jgi:hypothetical protein